MTANTGATTTSDTARDGGVSTVRAFFEAIAKSDSAAIGNLLHASATWNHRNQDRFGGIHRGSDGIMEFIGEAMQLTEGTLRPMPQSFMPDGEGRVSVLVRLTGTRPDGRAADDLQMVLFTLDGNRVRTVDHFVGDPAAVAAFWA